MNELQVTDYDKAYSELEKSIQTALETYSNVHRGSGHYSAVTTALYEEAREIVTRFMGLRKKWYKLIFCTARGERLLIDCLHPGEFLTIGSSDLGLPLGVRAIAIKKKHLKEDVPFLRGGGTAKLIASDWVVWESGIKRYEAGTPPVINIIAFARALQISDIYGRNIFRGNNNPECQGFKNDDNELEGCTGHELLEKIRISMTGQKTMVPTAEGELPYVNLDLAASTPAFFQAFESFRMALRMSPASNKRIINDAKSVCSTFFNAPEDTYDIFFTSNTTEAINIVAENFHWMTHDNNEPALLTTILEHSSNDLPWRSVKDVNIIQLSTDENCIIDPKKVEEVLVHFNEKHSIGKTVIRLVTITGASNVLGIYNDIAEISKLAHKFGTMILVDAAQMAAHREIDMKKWEIDILVCSSHKMYAPFGSGVLLARKGLLRPEENDPEQVRMPAMENYAGIAAFTKSMILLRDIGFDTIREEECYLTGYALEEMKKIKGIKIFGVRNTDSIHFSSKGGVISFSIRKPWPHQLANQLAERGGIGIRSGCHCSHMLVKNLLGVGPGLEKFQRIMATLIPGITFPGVARISLGLNNTKDDIDHFTRMLKKIISEPDYDKKSIRKKIDNYTRGISEKVYGELEIDKHLLSHSGENQQHQ